MGVSLHLFMIVHVFSYIYIYHKISAANAAISCEIINVPLNLEWHVIYWQKIKNQKTQFLHSMVLGNKWTEILGV